MWSKILQGQRMFQKMSKRQFFLQATTLGVRAGKCPVADGKGGPRRDISSRIRL